jgi:hypothetical protein
VLPDFFGGGAVLRVAKFIDNRVYCGFPVMRRITEYGYFACLGA